MKIKEYFRAKYLISYMRLLYLYCCCNGKLKVNGIKYFIGKGVEITSKDKGSILLENKIYISKNSKISSEGGQITIGYNTFFNEGCKIICKVRVDIGENCLFGPNVGIYDHNHSFSIKEELICKQGFTKKNIILGNDVWIGANVVITEGVSIGNRVIVGANSVVTKDLKKNGVYVGNPIRLVKSI